MRIHQCHLCGDCIDRQIVQAKLAEREISDPNNHEFERQRFEELLRERMRLMEEDEKIKGEET